MKIFFSMFLFFGISFFSLNVNSASFKFKIKNKDQSFACYKATFEGRREVINKKCKPKDVNMDTFEISDCSYNDGVATVTFTFECEK